MSKSPPRPSTVLGSQSKRINWGGGEIFFSLTGQNENAGSQHAKLSSV